MTSDNRTARVAFVGAGPGDPGLLTMRAAALLREADVVVLDQLCREGFIAPFVRDGWRSSTPATATQPPS